MIVTEHTSTEEHLRAQLMAAELELLHGRGLITIQVDHHSAFILITVLQLAVRHPALTERQRACIDTCGHQLQAAFEGPDTPQVALTLEQGWHREYRPPTQARDGD